MPKHVRKGDMVMVRAGNQRGTVAEILAVLPEENRVIVKGVEQARDALGLDLVVGGQGEDDPAGRILEACHDGGGFAERPRKLHH